MAVVPFPEFVGGHYTSRSPIADQEDTANWYIETMEVAGATSQSALYPAPGVDLLRSALTSGWRANFSDDNSGRSFGIVGGSFVEYDANWTITVRGTVAVDSNPGTISTNGDGGGQLLITSGDHAYSFDLATNTLTEELASGATMGGVLYGYGLVFDVATGRVRMSDLNDLTAWDPTQFFERSINADPWQAMAVTAYGYISLPGTQTGETWYNAGTFPIPFAPDPSGQFAVGIAATFSITPVGDTLMWLARAAEGGYTVVRQSGFTPQRVSTHPIEMALESYSDVSDGIGQAYQLEGHLTYALTLPTANVTWNFDSSVVGKANPWTRRFTWISETSSEQYWRPVFHAFSFGVHVMGDRDGAGLYQMALSLTTDVEDRPIRRVRRCPALMQNHQRIVCDWIELLFQAGVGTGVADTASVDNGFNPQVLLRVSRDGGRTWGNQRSIPVGKQGEYWVPVKAWQLGFARSFVFEVVVTSPVAWPLMAAYLSVRPTLEQRAA